MGGLLGSTKLGLTLRRAGVEDKQKRARNEARTGPSCRDFGIVWVGLASKHQALKTLRIVDLHSEPWIYTEASKILG
jgi:hypothetical protein